MTENICVSFATSGDMAFLSKTDLQGVNCFRLGGKIYGNNFRLI